jgi:hypothetical protein
VYDGGIVAGTSVLRQSCVGVTMKRIAVLIGILSMVMSVVAHPAGAVAQVGGSKQLVTGQTVAWSAEWTQEPSASFVDQDVELLALSRGTTIVGYGGTAFAVPGNQVRDVILEGFTTGGALQQVDRGQYDNVSYSIDLATADGVQLALFTLVIESPNRTSIALLIDSPQSFQGGLQAAQAGITVDGAPIFQGVDAAQMQQTINAATGSVQPPLATTPAAPPVLQTPTPAAPQTPAGGLVLPPVGGTTPAAQLPPPPTPGAVAPPANSMVIGTGGVELRYSNDWFVLNQDASSARIAAVTDPIVLLMVIDLGPQSNPIAAADLGPALIAQFPEMVDAQVVAAVDVPDGRDIVVLLDPSPDGPLYHIYEVTPDPVASTLVEIILAQADLQAGVRLVSTTVQLKGKPVLADLPTLVPALFPAGG